MPPPRLTAQPDRPDPALRPRPRLFIAVDPPAETCRRAAVITNQLREAGLTARWVDPALLHLTLHFLGDGLPAEPLPAVMAAVNRAAAACQPFELAFGGLGMFPPRGRPRVIWLGITRGADALGGLHETVGRELAALGLPLERRPFQPHLTIGRLAWAASRRDRPGAVNAVIEQFAGVSGGGGRIAAVAVFSSQLDPAGAIHTRLHKATFGHGVRPTD